VDRCAGFEVIHLGSNHPISLREMIDTVALVDADAPNGFSVSSGDGSRSLHVSDR